MAVRRRHGTHKGREKLGPGSAAHRYAPRCIRDDAWNYDALRINATL